MSESKIAELIRTRNELAKLLPFMPDPTGKGCNLHGLYQWQLDLINSKERYGFVCAANQIGKSVGNWIRMLRHMYMPELWEEFYGGQPHSFWYFYPSAPLSTAEIKTKYIRRYLPHESLKKHKRWGYKVDEAKGNVTAIHSATGVSVYFKSYSQPPDNLQAATLSGIFGDEEMPEKIIDELNFRGVSQDNFYYRNVFTATKGQEYLRRTIEERGERENFVGAFKRQISMYDCLTYADGRPSDIWTREKIEQAKAECTSNAEIQRRIYGRFVVSEDRKFHGFDHGRNSVPGHVIPGSWLIYGGIDWGSGGRKGHPSAICILAVSPDYKQGRVFKCWRGDGIPTTQGDVVVKYCEMVKGLQITEAAYDYSASDIGMIASRNGISLSRANKQRDASVELINTLFKNGQLKIYTGEGYEESDKLISEVATALTNGSKVNDDLIDALRYVVTLVPWQFQILPDDIEETKSVPIEARLSKREEFWKYGYKGSELWDSDGEELLNDYMELHDEYVL
jgi:hypothetical protein